MGKLFNLATGDQVYIEDCVLENDELDQSIDIPEDINPVEFIDKDLDNQLDEPMLDSFMESISTTTPEVLPSCKDYRHWSASQEEYLEYEAKVMFLEEEMDRLLKERYQNEVVIPYRKELREWWFNRQDSKNE
jgi:hypothetical protein